jgi:hypothetical protein
MIFEKVTAEMAIFGNRLFDSEFAMPKGSPKNNATLTLVLRVNLNFADGTNKTTRIVTLGGTNYAADYDGWLFPILAWTNDTKKRYRGAFVTHGESVWNGRFWLKTPKVVAPFLEYTPGHGGPTYIPNVHCLFKIKIVSAKESPHKTINLYHIDTSITTVSNLDTTKGTKTVDGASSHYRSDDFNYDSLDFLRPKTAAKVTLGTMGSRLDKVLNGALSEVRKDTIGHELGHAIGQSHIAYLLDPSKSECKLGTATNGAAACYAGDDTNVMSGGDRLSLLNAISWQERMAEHSGTKASDWAASMMILEPKVKPVTLVKPAPVTCPNHHQLVYRPKF